MKVLGLAIYKGYVTVRLIFELLELSIEDLVYLFVLRDVQYGIDL